MKQFYVLTTAFVFFTVQLKAQFTQNFDAVSALTSGCNLTVNSDRTVTSGEIINGTASLFSNPPVNGSGTRDYLTPYLDVIDPSDPLASSTSLSVAFSYKLNETLNGQAVRTIEIGLQDKAGIFTSLATIAMDKDNDPQSAVSFSQVFTVPTGVYRLALKMGGSQGNGSVRIIIDDLVVSADPHYSLGGTCNMAPVVTNDVYFTGNFTTPTLFASVLDNDTDPNNESFSAPAVTAASPDGTVVFNADGSFTFTPNPGFTGSSTTFTYSVTDNGYDQMTGTGLVTINFAATSVLPVKLSSFNGRLSNNKASVNWTVTNNEHTAKFELEKSTDGNRFSTASVILPTNTKGMENYRYTDNYELNAETWYRLKIVNANNTIQYSGLIKIAQSNVQNHNSPLVMQTLVVNSLNLSYTSQSNGTGRVNVYDMYGKRLLTQPWTLQKGSNITSININNGLIPGIYLLEITCGMQKTVAKFMKQ